MKIQYTNYKPQKDARYLIEVSNKVIYDYSKRGYSLTLRQLYYQIVSRGLFPDNRRWSLDQSRNKWRKDEGGTKNAPPNYNWLKAVIKNGRDAGLIDWNAIIDRTRNRKGLTVWKSQQQILNAVTSGYRMDKWRDQDYRVFVWVEKEALEGVIEQACTAEDVQVEFIACRGYMSASTLWREARKMIDIMQMERQTPVFLHLGDFDPSGVDMSRDNLERLEMYSGGFDSSDFIFKRIALNKDQIKLYSPPSDPAKITDSRFKSFVEKYGGESYELDAIDPDDLVALIRDEVSEYKDEDKWKVLFEQEQQQKAELGSLSKNWKLVAKYLESLE